VPVAGQRDPEQIKGVLEPWLARQLHHASAVEITDLQIPQSSGFSNETYLLDATWREGGRRVGAEFVLRSQPAVHRLFPEADLIAQQYLSMKLLGDTNVPVARVRWAERDPAVLGGPFFVMDRLHGLVPGDNPPYTQAGFVVDMTPEQRARWAHNGVEAMTRVARVDWQAAGFQHLDLQHHGTLGPEQRRNYFANYLQWAWGDQPHPVVRPAWDWLLANWPDDGEHIELCWGDARPGNQMYAGADHTEVIGVFDWEMVSLGNSESDLAWWLFLQSYSLEAGGAEMLPGMLDRDATVALWEKYMDRTAEYVQFYEVLAGFQFCLVMIKLAEAFSAESGDPAMAAMAIYNPVADLTADLIGIARPEPPATGAW
jgi:aminoglycoside phosphotransferase (APT) family kinase protein